MADHAIAAGQSARMADRPTLPGTPTGTSIGPEPAIPTSLQGLAPECVVYAGRASKTLTPALRLGWIAAPPWLVNELLREKLF